MNLICPVMPVKRKRLDVTNVVCRKEGSGFNRVLKAVAVLQNQLQMPSTRAGKILPHRCLQFFVVTFPLSVSLRHH